MTFRLSPEITLPATAPTNTFAFLGTRGSGKTYGAGVLAEELLAASFFGVSLCMAHTMPKIGAARPVHFGTGQSWIAKYRAARKAKAGK